ncbi:MAG: hypothetical protein HYX54_00345 [Chloroflexi bacterium]|nr:hypothetical protein [Chloroflexota bacterium]
MPAFDFVSSMVPTVSSRRDRGNHRQFVPVELVGDRLDAAVPTPIGGRTVPAGAAVATPSDLVVSNRWQDRMTLFGELDR